MILKIKERELLKKILATRWLDHELSCEVEELLEQPEQEREPLGLEIMDVCGSEDYREGFKDGALYAEKCHDIGGKE
jgi:hypothetical protein